MAYGSFRPPAHQAKLSLLTAGGGGSSYWRSNEERNTSEIIINLEENNKYLKNLLAEERERCL
jgi:hypothetical protein